MACNLNLCSPGEHLGGGVVGLCLCAMCLFQQRPSKQSAPISLQRSPHNLFTQTPSGREQSSQGKACTQIHTYWANLQLAGCPHAAAAAASVKLAVLLLANSPAAQWEAVLVDCGFLLPSLAIPETLLAAQQRTGCAVGETMGSGSL